MWLWLGNPLQMMLRTCEIFGVPDKIKLTHLHSSLLTFVTCSRPAPSLTRVKFGCSPYVTPTLSLQASRRPAVYINPTWALATFCNPVLVFCPSHCQWTASFPLTLPKPRPTPSSRLYRFSTLISHLTDQVLQRKLPVMGHGSPIP
jgi:hypothetical protein